MAICCICSSVSPSASGKIGERVAGERPLAEHVDLDHGAGSSQGSRSFLACEDGRDLGGADRAGAQDAKATSGLQTAEIEHG